MPDQKGQGLKILCHQRGHGIVVSPDGEIDLNASPSLRAEIKRVQASKPGLMVVDLSKVPYMDSSGVATLVEAMQIARRNGTRLVLAAMTARVRSIFEIARLETVFKIVASIDDAFATPA